MDNRSLAFHGLAIKRHADAAAVASLTGLGKDVVADVLARGVATGRVVEVRDAYSLTPLARVALQAGYDKHFADLRQDDAFVAAYFAFEKVNPEREGHHHRLADDGCARRTPGQRPFRPDL